MPVGAGQVPWAQRGVAAQLAGDPVHQHDHLAIVDLGYARRLQHHAEQVGDEDRAAPRPTARARRAGDRIQPAGQRMEGGQARKRKYLEEMQRR